MSMRISSQQLYNSGVGGISRLQSSLYTLQNQVATGRKIQTPQDNPVGAAQSLVVTQSSQVNKLYISNQGEATAKLGLLDSTLGGVTAELQNIYEKAVAGGNGTYSDSDRVMIATELQEKLSNLLALANTQDGMGRYVFSGFQSTTKPFAVAENNTAQMASSTPYSGKQEQGNSYVSYSGDDGERILQVSSNHYMKTNATGNEVFMAVRDSSGTVTEQSVFDAVQNMIVYLQTPNTLSTAETSSPQYTQALGDIGAALENVSRIHASVGGRLSALETMTNTAEDRALQYSTQLSNLEDLDYAKALTQVSQQKVQLEAAQATYTTMAKLSLFNYI